VFVKTKANKITADKKASRKYLIRICDSLWSKVVRGRDRDTCQRCGRFGNNPHHIFSRKNLSTRWLEDNGITLCWACHRHYAHGDPEPFRDFIIGRIGEDAFQRLKMQAYSVSKLDLTLVRVMLEQQLKGVGNGSTETVGMAYRKT
jgi:hypothetical protein